MYLHYVIYSIQQIPILITPFFLSFSPHNEDIIIIVYTPFGMSSISCSYINISPVPSTQWFYVIMMTLPSLITLGAHVQRELKYLVCLPVCVTGSACSVKLSQRHKKSQWRAYWLPYAICYCSYIASPCQTLRELHTSVEITSKCILLAQPINYIAVSCMRSLPRVCSDCTQFSKVSAE